MPYLVRNVSGGVSRVESVSSGEDDDDRDHELSTYDDDVDYPANVSGVMSSMLRVHTPPPHLMLGRTHSPDYWQSQSRASMSSSSSSSSVHDFVNDTQCGTHSDELNEEEVEELTEEVYPPECYCPISHCVMTNPVLCADGHTYEKKHIEKWLSSNSTSPNTNMVLPHKQLVPNHALRSLIQLVTNQTKAASLAQISKT